MPFMWTIWVRYRSPKMAERKEAEEKEKEEKEVM